MLPYGSFYGTVEAAAVGQRRCRGHILVGFDAVHERLKQHALVRVAMRAQVEHEGCKS